MITPTEHEFALKLLDDTRDGVMRMLNGACLGSHTNRGLEQKSPKLQRLDLRSWSDCCAPYCFPLRLI